MHIIHHIHEWKNIRQHLPVEKNIGFVPTMGNLHAGHTHLLKKAREQNDIVVLSLFVNNTQFNDPKDYERYPRTLENDCKTAEQVQVDYVLIPNIADIYPDEYRYQIMETLLSQEMEGQFRPGHFTGMMTVVLKLLLLVKAQRAYFGEKDFQQLQLVQGLVNAFFLDTKIIPCETIREPSGLPLSSRNTLLNEQEKKLACEFAQIFKQSSLSLEEMQKQLLQLGIHVDYLQEKDNRRFVAVKIGQIRLIDNRLKE